MRRFASIVLSSLAIAGFQGGLSVPHASADPPTCAPGWNGLPLDTPDPPVPADVEAIAPDDVWVVGQTSQPKGAERAAAVHWDGSRWTETALPWAGQGFSGLLSVSATGPNDVWSAGFQGDRFGILHFDGSDWSEVDTPHAPPDHTYELLAIAALTPDDAWAVGDVSDGEESTTSTLIEHWDGTRWRVVPSPNPGANGNALRAVDVEGPDEAWAVGYTKPEANGTGSLVLRWDGKAWEVVPGPTSDLNDRTLVDVATANPGDVWTVGNFDDQRDPQSTGQTFGYTAHYNGTWTVASTDPPRIGDAYDSMGGVVAPGPGDVWTTGTIDRHAVTRHFDGTDWTVVPIDADVVTGPITTDSAGGVWTIGFGPSGPSAFHLCSIPTDVGDLFVFTPSPLRFPAHIGIRGSFDVVVWNAGPATARDVRVTDRIPTGVVFAYATSSAGTCHGPPKAHALVHCHVRKLAPGASVTLSFWGDLVAGPTAVNATRVDSPSDPFASNDRGEFEISTIGENCSSVGTQARDAILGSSGDDVICTLGGNDVVNGGRGNDVIYGGPGNDILDGGDGSDTIDGGPGRDRCFQDRGNGTQQNCER